jgi:hypothetical protein
MVADSFTKPLQGVIFRQLWDIIMGNTTIKLPLDIISNTNDKASGIPAVSTQQKSRSVLEIENEIMESPHSPTVSSTYVRTQPEKNRSGVHLLTGLPVYGKINDNTIENPSNMVIRKRILSWAEIAGRRRKE